MQRMREGMGFGAEHPIQSTSFRERACLFVTSRGVGHYLSTLFFVIALLWLNLKFPGIANAQVPPAATEESRKGSHLNNEQAPSTEHAEGGGVLQRSRVDAIGLREGTGLASEPASKGRRARTIGELSTSLTAGAAEGATRASSDGFFTRYLRTLGVLVLVVGATVLLATWIRRRVKAPRRADGSRFVDILSRTIVTPKQQLVLVRVGERALLLGVSPERFDKLVEFDEPQEVIAMSGQAMSRSGTFADTLRGEGGGFDEAGGATTLGEPSDPNLEPYRHEIERLKAMVGNWRLSNSRGSGAGSHRSTDSGVAEPRLREEVQS